MAAAGRLLPLPHQSGCAAELASTLPFPSSVAQAAVWQPDMGPNRDRIVFDPWTLRIR